MYSKPKKLDIKSQFVYMPIPVGLCMAVLPWRQTAGSKTLRARFVVTSLLSYLCTLTPHLLLWLQIVLYLLSLMQAKSFFYRDFCLFDF